MSSPSTRQTDGADTDGQLPPHGHISHGSARFLLWVGEQRDRLDGFDPDISELGDLYREWKRRTDDGEQSDLSGWSE